MHSAGVTDTTTVATVETVDAGPTADDAVRRDLGATFIEILVSVVLLGTAGVAVLTALATAAAGASTQRSVAEAQSSLASAGDAVSEADPDADDYLDCDANSPSDIIAGYQATVDAVRAPSAAPVVVTGVEFWNSTSETYGAACRFDPEGDRLQRVTLATDTGGSTHELAVVKRPASEPTLNVGPLPPGGSGATMTPTPTPGLDGP